MRSARCIVPLCKAAFLGLLFFLPHSTCAQQPAWIATWAASPQPVELVGARVIEDQTVRERVRLSVGGSQIRFVLSNECGSAPLTVGSVTVALPVDPATVKPASIQTVTFGGQKSVTIAAGAPIFSDPVALSVAPGAEISISLYFPKRLTAATLHTFALKRNIISPPGDHTRDEKIEGGTARGSYFSLKAVLVPAQASHRLLVAFGDSTTDGDGSTPDADRNWPSDLVRRLNKTRETPDVAVVNEGIVGNRLLSDCSMPAIGCFSASGVARFDRDALGVPGVTHVLLLEGLNDIGFPGATLAGQSLAGPSEIPTLDDFVAAYRQLIARAHARGVKVIGATISPFEGVDVPGYYSDSKEATRQAVNKWIRTSGVFDGVVDFDAVLRDPDHPTRLLPRFASEDHLHPNDAGYQAMADSIDLTLLQ